VTDSALTKVIALYMMWITWLFTCIVLLFVVADSGMYSVILPCSPWHSRMSSSVALVASGLRSVNFVLFCWSF